MKTFFLISYFLSPFFIVIGEILYCIANNKKFSFIEIPLSISFYLYFILAPFTTWCYILIFCFEIYAIIKNKTTDQTLIDAMEFCNKIIKKNKE